jgi:hypothetical protein
MVERSTDTPAVFVVTIREEHGESGQLQGSVTPVAASGCETSPKRWFRSLDQLPAILRSLLARLKE